MTVRAIGLQPQGEQWKLPLPTLKQRLDESAAACAAKRASSSSAFLKPARGQGNCKRDRVQQGGLQKAACLACVHQRWHTTTQSCCRASPSPVHRVLRSTSAHRYLLVEAKQPEAAHPSLTSPPTSTEGDKLLRGMLQHSAASKDSHHAPAQVRAPLLQDEICHDSLEQDALLPPKSGCSPQQVTRQFRVQQKGLKRIGQKT